MSFAIVSVCGIILLAPKYVKLPAEGGYVKYSTLSDYKHIQPSIDWDWVIQRSLIVVLVAFGLLYTSRKAGEK